MRHEKNWNTKIILAFAAGLLIAGGIYVTNRAGWLTTENGRSDGVRDDGVSVQQVKELKKINIQSQTALQQSREELRASNSKLLTLKNQLKELNNVCLTLKVKTKEQESLLQNANQSLAQLEKEFNLKRKQIKRQRNIAYVIAVCALYVAIKN